MRLILHILAKDLRRHRWELLLYVFACAAWAWQMAKPVELDWLRQKELVPILFFGMWFILVIRAVQGESLVGDREFWMTRPYRWSQLIAAKALFLVLCLNGPFIIAQAIMLHVAHIPLTASVCGGLLFLQLEFIFYFTFPAAALAAVTESLVQWGLFIAGMLVYVMVLTWFPWDRLPPGLEGGENLATILGMVIITPALVFVLIWQYARRRVWPARLAFAGTLLYVPLLIWLSSTPLIRSFAYPRTKTQVPLNLSITDDSGSRTYSRTTDGPSPDILLPVIASTSDPDTLVDVDGLQVTLTGDNGWRWQSQWINHSIKFSKESPDGAIRFTLSEKLADDLQKTHARASVEMAFSVYRMAESQEVNTNTMRFQLPGPIYCDWGNSTRNEFFISGPRCVAPLRLPEMIEVRINSDSDTCFQVDSSDSPLPPHHFASDIEYGTSLPADFDPDPVHKLNLNIGLWDPPIPTARDPKQNRQAEICKGTPLTVRTGTYRGKMRATYDLGLIGTERRIDENPDESVTFHPLQK
ncbi:MAG: hypothetical protein WBL41_09385 [Terracidiphilus sp.]